MSDTEKSLANKLAELPAEIQDKFLLMAQGAAVAAETLKEMQKDKAEAESRGGCASPQ